MRENKEKEGKTIRFSIRLPKEEHKWLKEKSEGSRKRVGEYKSMNEYITEIVRKEMNAEKY